MAEFRISDPILRRMVYAVGAMGVVAFAFYTIGLLRNSLQVIINILTPFLAAFLVAYILAPVVIALQRRLRLGRIMGTLVLYMMMLMALFLLLAVIIPKVVSELIAIFEVIRAALPVLLDKLAQNPYVSFDAELIETIRQWIQNIQIDYEKIVSYMLPGLKRLASGGFEVMGVATRGIFTGLGSVIGFFSFLAFVGIINFYLIVDWEKIRPLLTRMVPPEHRGRVLDVAEKIDRAVGGFLRGQLTVSLIVGSLFAVGLFFMGFSGFPALRNYSFLIGSAAAIGGFIPYLGALVGVTPAILIVLLTGGVAWTVKMFSLMAVLAIFAGIQAVEGFILQPRIVGKGAGLHPLVVMLALIAGAQFGIGGMIIAVPMASILRVVFVEFYWRRVMEREGGLPAGRRPVLNS